MHFGIEEVYQVGATYEPFNDFAEGHFFAKYMLVCHPARYEKQK